MGSDPGGLSQFFSNSVSASSANLRPSGISDHLSIGGAGGGGLAIRSAVRALAPGCSAVEALAVDPTGGLMPAVCGPSVLADDLVDVAVPAPRPSTDRLLHALIAQLHRFGHSHVAWDVQMRRQCILLSRPLSHWTCAHIVACRLCPMCRTVQLEECVAAPPAFHLVVHPILICWWLNP